MKQEPKELKAVPLPWHPAFFAGLQIELREEAEQLYFEQEHLLGAGPVQMDVLVVKKSPDYQVKKNIGRIFRRYNIVEYKSPEDYLSIDDFYKAYAYVCLYKSHTGGEDAVSARELTLTLVTWRCPRKLIRHWEEVWGYRIRQAEAGIYYVREKPIAIQLIVTSKLAEGENRWLRNLTNDLRPEEARRLLREYGEHKKEPLYESIMDLIARANARTFQEVKEMCQALEELMKDELEDREQRGMEAGIEVGMERGIEKGIEAMIRAFRNLNITEGEICRQLQKECHLSEEAARQYMSRR